MKRLFGMMIGAVLWFGATPALAQPADQNAQALGQCLVLKSTGEDRLVIARWMIGALARGPQAADIVTLNKAKKETLDRQIAALFTRLLVRDCKAEARAVFKEKSSDAMKVASSGLGTIAMRELLSDPQAAAAFKAFTQYLSEADF